jgi:hypothetical protein
MQKSSTPSTHAASRGGSVFMWLGIVLLAAGLSGHLFAARAIGGYYIAYRDHIVGFVGLTIISGLIIAVLGWRFWRGRRDITVLILGLVQAIVGLIIYINRFHVF